MKFSLLRRSHIVVLNCVATLLVFACVSFAQAPTKYSVAQLKELSQLPPSAQVTGAITKLNTAGIASPTLAVVELDNQLVCEISFAPRNPSGRIKIEKDSGNVQVGEEILGRAVTCKGTSKQIITKSILRILSVGQTVTVSGIFVRKGNGTKLTGQLVGR